MGLRRIEFRYKIWDNDLKDSVSEGVTMDIDSKEAIQFLNERFLQMVYDTLKKIKEAENCKNLTE